MTDMNEIVVSPHDIGAVTGRANTDALLETDVETSSRMSRQARAGTKPELELRRKLHSLGFRYRVDHPISGLKRRRADIVFTRAKVAVFVDGCFWHACPIHGTRPERNGAWWAAKLQRNIDRDRDTDLRLGELGWTVLRFWEHEGSSECVEEISAVVTSKPRLT